MLSATSRCNRRACRPKSAFVTLKLHFLRMWKRGKLLYATAYANTMFLARQRFGLWSNRLQKPQFEGKRLVNPSIASTKKAG